MSFLIINLNRRYKRFGDVEQPLQVQLGCFLSGKPTLPRTNKYVLISVNSKMIQARLQYTCININRYLQRGNNVIRISCPSGVPQEVISKTIFFFFIFLKKILKITNFLQSLILFAKFNS